MGELKTSLKELGLALNEVEPEGTKVKEIVKSIGESLTGETIEGTNLSSIVSNIAFNYEGSAGGHTITIKFINDGAENGASYLAEDEVFYSYRLSEEDEWINLPVNWTGGDITLLENVDITSFQFKCGSLISEARDCKIGMGVAPMGVTPGYGDVSWPVWPTSEAHISVDCYTGPYVSDPYTFIIDPIVIEIHYWLKNNPK